MTEQKLATVAYVRSSSTQGMKAVGKLIAKQESRTWAGRGGSNAKILESGLPGERHRQEVTTRSVLDKEEEKWEVRKKDS